MTLLLIGCNGQVGFEFCRLVEKRGTVPNFAAIDYPEIDLASADSIVAAVRDRRPSLIINAAAYTAVDRAESEPELAAAINADAPGIIAGELRRTGGTLVHYSTDYVFNGAKDAPYTEEDAPNPLGVYGRTKLAGEEAVRSSGIRHLLLRSSWIYGVRGSNFLLTMLRLAREREELRVVDDQVGAPTWSRLIAEKTLDILDLDRNSRGDAFAPGLYHLTASGETSWYGFARRILDLDPAKDEQLLQRLLPIPTSDYPTPARRPRNSRLDCARVRETFGIELPPWDESLTRVMAGL